MIILNYYYSLNLSTPFCGRKGLKVLSDSLLAKHNDES